jgi:hypothetical protein
MKQPHSLLSQILTNLRGKYIAAFKNKDFNQQEVLIELELLAKETSEKISPKLYILIYLLLIKSIILPQQIKQHF